MLWEKRDIGEGDGIWPRQDLYLQVMTDTESQLRVMERNNVDDPASKLPRIQSFSFKCTSEQL